MRRQGEGGPVMSGTFEIDGQRFHAFNGGPMFKFSEAVSLFVNCETQDEVDALWDKLSDRRHAAALRLAQGQVRPVLADHPVGARQAAAGQGPGEGAARRAGDDGHGQDRHRRDRARLRRIDLHRRSTRGSIMQPHKVVSYEEWLVARKAHLKQREGADPHARHRRGGAARAAVGEGDEELCVRHRGTARRSLADLFGGNSQLIVHHFMWRHDLDSGCPSCSFEADHAEGALVHLDQPRCELCARRARAARRS